MTHALERVGTRGWMAPWAHENIRLAVESVNPKLDIFPLAKVLWSMISGNDGLPFWDFDHENYDLRLRFPDNPIVEDIHHVIFSKCLVRNEAECLSDATELRQRVEALIGKYQRGGMRIDARPWPCRMCGVGKYIRTELRSGIPQSKDNGSIAHVEYAFRYACEYCGHIEFFTKEIPEAPADLVTKTVSSSNEADDKYRERFEFAVEPDLTLSIFSSAVGQYNWIVNNRALDDHDELQINCESYRTFDVSKQAFRKTKPLQFNFESSGVIEASGRSNAQVFASFSGGRIHFGNQHNHAVPEWPPLDVETPRRWMLNFTLKLPNREVNLNLLIRSDESQKTLHFRRYTELLPLSEV